MNNKLFRGIMPAMITPIEEDGSLKESSARRIMERSLEQGVQGFYINGNTGEGLLLSESTRMNMAEISLDVCHRRGVVINHIGAVDAQSAIRLARHAGQIGCDAISSMVPNYVQEYSDDQILDYYKRIADASSLPVLVYCTGFLKSDPVDFMQKAINIDGIIGLKYTMFNYYNMQRISELNAGNINVINGPDEMLICGLLMGADGGIGSTYNIMPDWFAELYNTYQAGDIVKAREIQIRINKVITVLLKHSCIPAIKETLNLMGYDSGNAAYPGKRFTVDQRKELLSDLKTAGYSI